MFNRLLFNIKHRSNVTLRAWSYQCESIIAQRSRRIQQLLTFYHRVYGSNGLRQLLRSYRTQFQPPLRGLMLSAVGAAGLTFDWNTERIKLSNFDVCLRDIEFIENLHRNEICPKCAGKNMKHCYCSAKKNSTANEEISWEPYISKDEFTIWRREERSSLYSYKVYARFDDITATDLLHVQTDIDYRKQWDETAVTLELIETDSKPEANSHLIYWEMRWPKMFANRDYVYCRRFITDKNRKIMMIYNRSTSHPKYPEFPDKTRVTEYWSYMVIKPFQTFDEPGIHYILTYYDDPGLSIPQAVKSWVTQSQMPDFLKKMYLATKKYTYNKTTQTEKWHGIERLNNLNNNYNQYIANDGRNSRIKASQIQWQEK